MKSLKNGFTLVEVALFMAISGAIVAGIIVGTASVIDTQRYNDSVQNFAEFMRSVYSQVANPSGSANGRSDKSIYGKLVTFGESLDLKYENNAKDQRIFVYNVIGDINNHSINGDVLHSLAATRLSPFMTQPNSTNIGYVGTPTQYILNWDAKLQDTLKNQFKGSILIVRSPTSGTIYTFTSSSVIEVNQIYSNIAVANMNPLNNLADIFEVSNKDIDFCIVPEGYKLSSKPRNIRIAANAHEASSVEIVPADTSDNRCQL